MRPFRSPFRPTTGDAPHADAAATPRVSPASVGSPAGMRPRAPWPDLATLVDGSPGGRLSRRQAQLWSLVLRARRVPHRVRSLPAGYGVQVPQRFARQAVEEILLYQQENVSPHPAIPLPPAQERARPTAAAMLALCAFYAITHRPFPGLGWYPQYWRATGVADALGMLHGELWRSLTALTLHADPAHVASNAVVGGAFLILLSRRTGSGFAWLAAILAGALGNVLNALAHAAVAAAIAGPEHLSLGFSTAVFGAAGALAGLKAAAGDGDLRPGALIHGRGWLTPVAAGLALVATLGTGGEDTDVGAHVFGLFAGLALGGLLGRLALRLGRPDEWADGRANAAAGIAAGLLPVLAWVWGWLACWPGVVR